MLCLACLCYAGVKQHSPPEMCVIVVAHCVDDEMLGHFVSVQRSDACNFLAVWHDTGNVSMVIR